MATVLRVLNLRIRTTAGWQEEEFGFGAGVVVIHGPADTGKSSFPDAIAFGLGQPAVRFRGAVRTHLKEVELTVDLAGRVYVLRRRRWRSGSVDVSDILGSPIGTFPVLRDKTTPGRPTMSDWLLGKLGLTKHLSMLGSPVAFYSHLWPILYRDQGDIDRPTLFPPLNAKTRLLLVESLLGINDVDLVRQHNQLEKDNAAIARRLRTHKVLEQMLAKAEETDPVAIARMLTAARAREQHAAASVASLRQAQRCAEAFMLECAPQLHAAEHLVTVTAREQWLADRELIAATEALAQARAYLAELAVTDGENLTDPVELEVIEGEYRCEACSADLLAEVPPPGHCMRCARALTGPSAPSRFAANYQFQKHTKARQQACDAFERARRAAAQAVADSADLAARVRRDAGGPGEGEVVAAEKSLAAVRQQIQDLSGVERALRTLADDHEQLLMLQTQNKARLNALGLAARAGAEHRREVLTTFNSMFRETVAKLELPNATGLAFIDEKTLMPWVDGEPFDARGGGSRVAVALAYNLTFLRYALEHPECAFPSLLLIDSPGKNLGRNANDRRLARSVYDHVIELVAEHQQIPGQRVRPLFQLIMIDNDRPVIGRHAKIHTLSYGNGFLKNVEIRRDSDESDYDEPGDDDALEGSW